MNPIRNMDYAIITSRKGVKGSGLDLGQIVLVVGTKVLPAKKSDPYLQRVYVVAILVTSEGEHCIPNPQEGDEDNGYRSYLLDPRHLTKLDDDASEELREKLNEQYGS